MAYKSKKMTATGMEAEYPHGTQVDRITGKAYPGGSGTPRVLTRYGVSRIFSDSNSDTIDGLSELKIKGYAFEHGGKMELELKCEELIGGVGFTIISDDSLSPGLKNMKNFSLVGSVNVDDTIMNSKIMDPDIDKLTPIKIEAIDKIKSENDPFYELDQQVPNSVKFISSKEKRKDRKKAIRVAKTLTRITRKSPNKMLEKDFHRGERQ